MMPAICALWLHTCAGDVVFVRMSLIAELGFLEQCDEILASCQGAGMQRALFSATMQPAIEDLVHSVLQQPVKVVVGERNAAADTVEQVCT